ncbi:hypothetical protein TPHA_0J01830 [Tetrapisispora phaffii CBS 4417]|uniref:MTHFR SAM-binding regulatory domain-containing protein n=1 Tax=Tetrapisispora phaffii (strain ATCC 24235 / CBS 4417 / NBRC 1672 / NRRL Y-8282 / UCD 70-5) TaxID=1071381 RepID=G8BYR2_TETPH|nr:hypothetical protein TPHA_0J01830 [Tetrapisispora phaffii CBS 4417]CCE65004.1 hypothetical protein TPHA_0J01830 [Tetrapisispora phaffii CBS 4417]
MRITEKLVRSNGDESNGNATTAATFSFEYFVPRTTQGVHNLYDRMDRMYQESLPQFIDVTWNAGGVNNNLTNEIVFTAQSVLGLETCMHLTCTNMDITTIDKALQQAYESGCQNILALRGDPPLTNVGDSVGKSGNGGVGGADITDGNADADTAASGVFHYAKDLVGYIRLKYGDYFDIGVAGYPEGHEEEKDSQLLTKFLKEKIDCGANFIVTQMFYDVDNFLNWCKLLRENGINVPIIPGVMPISTYAAFLRRARWCKINIPDEFLRKLEPVKDDDEAVREVGTQLLVDMCRKILDSGYVSHLHLYTMNLEKAPLMILDKLNLLPHFDLDKQIDSHMTNTETTAYFDQRNSNTNETTLSMLPWRKSLNPKRKNEEVRPIFWQKRPYTYVARTSKWAVDEFPNGRFGDSSSPAFGDLDLCGSTLIRQSPKKSFELWSTPKTMNDLALLVISYLKGDIKCLPWSDIPISNEIDVIFDHLIELNQRNIITINSQPQVNGVRSNVKDIGWGPKDGYVYQKQYLEFLLPKEKLSILEQELENNDILTFFAIDCNGNLSSNHPDGSKANAVTWGIFPGREVLQPTIVEKISFIAWKEEFYRILEDWRNIFINNENDDSVALLNHLINDYVLVNIVDNDYIDPEDKIFTLLKRI